MALQNIAFFFLWWIWCWKQPITTKTVRLHVLDIEGNVQNVMPWQGAVFPDEKVSSVVRSQSLQSLVKGQFHHISPQVPWHTVVPKSTTCRWCRTDIIHPRLSQQTETVKWWSRQRRVWDPQGEIFNRNVVAIKERRRSRSRGTGVWSARFKGNATLQPPELFRPFF